MTHPWDGRTYAVVDWTPGFDRAFLQAFREAGGINAVGEDGEPYDAHLRKSLDGKFAILKWRGEGTLNIPAGKIVFQGDRDGILAYLMDPIRRGNWHTDIDGNPLPSSPTEVVLSGARAAFAPRRYGQARKKSWWAIWCAIALGGALACYLLS